jgi:hypothetical protein
MNKKIIQIEEVISLIHAAMGKCGQDFATSDVRGHLIAARIAAESVMRKRGNRAKQQSAMEEAIVKAKNSHNEWWNTIQENVRKKAKEDTQKPSESTDFPETK